MMFPSQENRLGLQEHTMFRMPEAALKTLIAFINKINGGEEEFGIGSASVIGLEIRSRKLCFCMIQSYFY